MTQLPAWPRCHSRMSLRRSVGRGGAAAPEPDSRHTEADVMSHSNPKGPGANIKCAGWAKVSAPLGKSAMEMDVTQ
eukprot:15435286-Alexandrium_andersonii.AAC.1